MIGAYEIVFALQIVNFKMRKVVLGIVGKSERVEIHKSIGDQRVIKRSTTEHVLQRVV